MYNGRLIFVLIACVIFIQSEIYAAKALPVKINYTQPDGTQVSNLSIVGDEFYRYYVNENRQKLVADSFGYLQVADASALQVRLKKAYTERNQLQKKIKSNFESGSRKIKANAETKRIPVILVEFSDVKFTIPTASFQRFFNAPDYTENGATGSVATYFTANSAGRLNPVFDILGTVTLSKSLAYYGANTNGSYDTATREMVVEACNMLDATTDFSIYDQYTDGEIDAIYFVFAGYSESEGASANAIWPKSWFLETPITLDGKSFSKFTCTAELAGNTGTTICGIGTFCHEFSHKLGLVDLYDTDYGVNGYGWSVGDWSIMGSGNYLNGGKTPPFYSAIDRQLAGFGQAVLLSDPQDIELQSIDKNIFYQLNTPNEGEYFLLENRQKNSWDNFIPANGLLITHIERTAAKLQLWNENKVNSIATHPCVDVIEADLVPGEYSASGDVFPGTSQKTAFTNETLPASLSWLGKKSATVITNIQESNGIVRFKVNGGKPWYSELNCLPPTDVSAGAFTAHISPIPEAEQYLLSVYTKTATNLPDDSISNSFDALPEFLAQGWTFSGDELGSDQQSYGKTAPSFNFYLDRLYLTSPCTNNALTKLKFWSKAKNLPPSGATLLLEASTDYQGWTKLIEIKITSAKDSVFQLNIDPVLNYNAIRWTWKSSSAQLLIDDVVLYSGNVVIPDYLVKDLNIGLAESHRLEQIDFTAAPVYYSYKAQKGALVSLPSNEQMVELTNNIKISNQTDLIFFKQNRNKIQIMSKINTRFEIYNALGKLVHYGQLNANYENQFTLNAGIYFLQTEKQGFKFLIH